MEPFIGQIMPFAGNFAIRGWALCNGQLLYVNQNQALFSIIGTFYGGDGRTTFGLPDLRGRVPMHYGNGPGLTSKPIGQKLGQETHVLNIQEMPTHNHLTQNLPSEDQHVLLSTAAAVNEIPNEGDIPAAAKLGSGLSAQNVKAFGPPQSASIVNGQTISANTGLNILNNGGNLAHNNMQPYLTVNYLIALEGIFPSRS